MGLFLSNNEFYILYVSSNGSRLLAASKGSDKKWYLGSLHNLDASNQLSLKEAKNAKKAIKKWSDYEKYEFEIVKYTINVNEKLI